MAVGLSQPAYVSTDVLTRHRLRRKRQLVSWCDPDTQPGMRAQSCHRSRRIQQLKHLPRFVVSMGGANPGAMVRVQGVFDLKIYSGPAGDQ